MKKLSVKEVEGWEERFDKEFPEQLITMGDDVGWGLGQGVNLAVKDFIRQELAQAREEGEKLGKVIKKFHDESCTCGVIF